MAKKQQGSISSTEDIHHLLSEASDCVKVSRRNHQPLHGNNFYARKFLDLKARGVLLLNSLQKRFANRDDENLTNALTEVSALLKTFFTPEVNASERSESQKRIIFLYTTIIEPVLSKANLHTPTSELFPLEILNKTRDYIERIGEQANGSYEQGWYDACAVMVRRLLETLIIECYEHYGIADKIKGVDGNFLYLRDLIAQFLNDVHWNPSRNVKNALPKLKDIGDLSAHSRRYIAKQPDIDKLQKEIRLVIQELVYIAGFDKESSAK